VGGRAGRLATASAPWHPCGAAFSTDVGSTDDFSHERGSDGYAISPAQEVVMSISVVATGLVVEGPAPLRGKDARVVFVLDPFPASQGSRAHACEVVCHAQDLAVWVLEALDGDDRVEVTGQLVMERVYGPFEDDLSAVRVWIEATRVSDLDTEEE
jgi:hypothetical protein